MCTIRRSNVTPAALITAIVSDRGIHYPPYDFAPAAHPFAVAVA